ncbi:MAG: hypothetical protein IPO08_19205 [Xanthomonadales bacterium]|nr:hypothetical protein [Xanthomonadales bacterium]
MRIIDALNPRSRGAHYCGPCQSFSTALESPITRGSQVPEGNALALLSYQQQNDLLGNLDHIDDTRQKPRLPENAVLVVDEAHLLEEAFARTFASGESVWRLVGAARTLVQSDALSEANRRVLKNALPALLDARDGLRQLGASLQGDGVVLSRSPRSLVLDAPFVTALQRLLQSLNPLQEARDRQEGGLRPGINRRARSHPSRGRRLEARLALGLRHDWGWNARLLESRSLLAKLRNRPHGCQRIA